MCSKMLPGKDQFFIYSPLESETIGCNDVSLYKVQDWKPKIMNHYILVFGLSPEFKEESFTCTNYESNEYYLNADGTVYLYTSGKTFSQESYCIDNLLVDRKIDEHAIICYVPDNSAYWKVTDDLHTAAVAMSTVFLFLIVVIYICTPHKLDLQKRCTFACCGNLLLGFSILLINRTSIVTNISTNGCLTIGKDIIVSSNVSVLSA
ncbi:hypothetical protein Avbf_04767, partial [Armadillidium vulgare]